MAEKRALTKLIVEKTAPGGKDDVFVWDTKVPGFGVRIHPSGKRMYVYQYRTKTRQQRRVAIGLHGPLTVETARQAAADLYEAVRKGGDPAEEQKRAARRIPDTFEKVVDEFMLRYMAGKQRARSYIEDTRATFDNHVLPRWRRRDITTITRRDVIELLDAIVDEGKPIAANRTLAAIRKLFNWALQRGIVEATIPGALWYAQDDDLLKAIQKLGFAYNVMPHRGYPIKLLYHSLRRPRQTLTARCGASWGLHPTGSQTRLEQ